MTRRLSPDAFELRTERIDPVPRQKLPPRPPEVITYSTMNHAVLVWDGR